MAYIDVLSTTDSSIQVQLYALDPSYSKSDRVCSWYLNNRYQGDSQLGAKVYAGGSFTFGYLTANTKYNISVAVMAPGWSHSQDFGAVVKTEPPPVALWSWYKSNGSASAYQTKAAYDAISNKGSTTDFSYLVWNDLVDKTFEILRATGQSWDSRYTSYSATKMAAYDTTLTAQRFNSLRYNIGTHSATGIHDVSQGDIIYAWYFTTLANCINSWIGK